ncbi:MAG: hypothetical protein CM15mP78_07180 [Candidatus Poseidoniales archaeon]|nr:MAG: hypothetical protein CM15mP78_07180 [Candidatus Poseidoniales archaeon]
MLTGSNSTAARFDQHSPSAKSAQIVDAHDADAHLHPGRHPVHRVDVQAASDQDGDGLTYGLEYLMNTQPNDPDSDNDGLPDGWEWKYGLDPLSSSGMDGAVADPDGDGMSNLQEYLYLQPSGWDNSNTASVLDNGVWWNGTIPVNDWNEEDAMQFNQPACGASGSDGTGTIILCDEDPLATFAPTASTTTRTGLLIPQTLTTTAMQIVLRTTMTATVSSTKTPPAGTPTATACLTVGRLPTASTRLHLPTLTGPTATPTATA